MILFIVDAHTTVQVQDLQKRIELSFKNIINIQGWRNRSGKSGFGRTTFQRSSDQYS